MEIRTVSDIEDFIERHGPAMSGELKEGTKVVFLENDHEEYSFSMEMRDGKVVITS